MTHAAQCLRRGSFAPGRGPSPLDRSRFPSLHGLCSPLSPAPLPLLVLLTTLHLSWTSGASPAPPCARLCAPRLHGPCSLSSLAPSRSLRAPFNRSLSPRLHGLLPTTVHLSSWGGGGFPAPPCARPCAPCSQSPGPSRAPVSLTYALHGCPLHAPLDRLHSPCLHGPCSFLSPAPLPLLDDPAPFMEGWRLSRASMRPFLCSSVAWALFLVKPCSIGILEGALALRIPCPRLFASLMQVPCPSCPPTQGLAPEHHQAGLQVMLVSVRQGICPTGHIPIAYSNWPAFGNGAASWMHAALAPLCSCPVPRRVVMRPVHHPVVHPFYC